MPKTVHPAFSKKVSGIYTSHNSCTEKIFSITQVISPTCSTSLISGNIIVKYKLTIHGKRQQNKKHIPPKTFNDLSFPNVLIEQFRDIIRGNITKPEK